MAKKSSVVAKKSTIQVPKLTARCLTGHTWVMTDKQIKEANVDGVATCPTCGNAATVERASLKMK